MVTSSDRIRQLNDRFRAGDNSIPGHIMMTSGIAEITGNRTELLAALLGSIQGFDGFDEGNDPHGEHDFGAVEFAGKNVFWKIDYYAPDLQHGSEDPANLNLTVRVLTIMLAEEY